MTMTRIMTAALAATTILAAGCGGSSSSSGGSPEDQVRGAVTSYTQAFVDGDYGKTCSLMTTAARKRVEAAGLLADKKGGSCEETLKAAGKQLSSAERKQLEGFSVKAV